MRDCSVAALAQAGRHDEARLQLGHLAEMNRQGRVRAFGATEG